MLRTVTEQHGDSFTLWLHGRLASESVASLEHYWEHLTRYVPHAQVVVVLSDVSSIDAAGENLLERMRRGGTKFVVSDSVVQRVVGRIGGPTGASTGQGAPRAE